MADKAPALRQDVLGRLWHRRPPPESPAPSDPDWVDVPAGTFLMGSPESEGSYSERPQHEVTLSAFRMLRHEVTAARAGCPHPYCRRDGSAGDVNDVAWIDRNSPGMAHPVMQLEPNPWGLFDMLGNVLEWTADPNAEYPATSEVDPWASSGGWRVFRGGSVRKNDADWVRVARRSWNIPDFMSMVLGFRVVLPGRPELLILDH